MKPERSRRQAAEFRSVLAQGFDGAEPGSVSEEADGIDADWAVPVLVSLWSESLHHEDGDLVAIRPAIKRALAALRARRGTGHTRAAMRLVRLLAACADAHAAEIDEGLATLIGPDTEVHGVLKSGGTELQLTEDARLLYHGNMISEVAAVLGGGDPEAHLSGLRHLRRVPRDAAAERLWRGIYLRLVAVHSLDRFNGDAALSDLAFLPTHFFSQSFLINGASGRTDAVIFTSDEIGELLSTDDVDGKAGRTDLLLTSHPLHPVLGGYVTSERLIADSLAPWMQHAVHELDLWTPVISEVFEDEIHGVLRGLGLVAGTVTTSGSWRLRAAPTRGHEAHRIAADLLRAAADPRAYGRMPGEIDALAWHEETRELLLVECKSIHSVPNIHTVATTLSDEDARGWRAKVSAKADWIRSATGIRPTLRIIVIEGIRFGLVRVDGDSAEDDVQVFDKHIFREGVASVFAVSAENTA